MSFVAYLYLGCLFSSCSLFSFWTLGLLPPRSLASSLSQLLALQITANKKAHTFFVVQEIVLAVSSSCASTFADGDPALVGLALGIAASVDHAQLVVEHVLHLEVLLVQVVQDCLLSKHKTTL